MLKEYLTSIANVIRSILGGTDKINAQDFKDKIQEVYESGFGNGDNAGYDRGFDEGKQSEYDAFWENYQKSGNRTDYQLAFGGYGWSAETFKPKYDIVPIESAYMTFRMHNEGNEPYDLAEHLSKLGVALDFTQCTFASYTFYGAVVSRIGVINVTLFGSLISFFYGCKAETIDKVILKSNGTNSFNATFNNCTNLKNITFEGVIGQNGLNFQWSPLTIESLRSIISCLKDYSTYTGSTVYKVTVGSTNLAKLTTEDMANIEAKGWIFD